MSLNIIYPSSTRDFYAQNDIVDFLVSYENKRVVASSIRITGVVRVVTAAGDRINTSQDLNLDSVVGIHNAFQSITSSCDSFGIIENNTEYPRTYRMKLNASQSQSAMGTESDKSCELKLGNDPLSKYLLLGNNAPDGDSGEGKDVSFSFKPDIAFNKSSGDISFGKCGALKVSLRLSTNSQFLYGTDAAGYKYEIRNLQMQYYTAPDQKAGGIAFESLYTVKGTAESNNTSLSTRVPAIVRSVSCVFVQQLHLDSAEYNNLVQERPPDVQRVEFSFNDSTTQYVSFVFKNHAEILYNYQRSLGFSGKSNMSQQHIWRDGDYYGIGIPFNQLVDMRQSKFGLNIVSGISNAVKYSVFMMFRGVVQL
jgi:hypothetical protein